jgi:hypothetical protein
MNKKLSIAIAAAIMVGFVSVGMVVGGPLPAIVFFVAAGGGLVLWLATTFRVPVDPLKVIVPYLLAVILFIIHVYEEYVTHFEGLVHDLTGFHVVERQFLTVAAFVVPVLWLLGAVLLLKRTNIGYYMLSFFFVAMTIAELSHFVFPFLQDGTFHYASGMYTAALPLIPAGYGLYVVIREVRRQRTRSPQRPVGTRRPVLDDERPFGRGRPIS